MYEKCFKEYPSPRNLKELYKVYVRFSINQHLKEIYWKHDRSLRCIWEVKKLPSSLINMWDVEELSWDCLIMWILEGWY